ncbi:hypothetical protein NitYY0826_C1663 [Nitratiruptor sp. YY08-26]|uniref:hypothetical protein n=1 Tax=unclassified Nitratiruptor TaxID=2624044 RepID=UPI001916BE67|nr:MULTISPECIES: hypothetical protein [unclassified Nitratiruptor]BCD62780.1 hypothetical protein NitYY0813_C1661 [Nitratiruptor sp. YY08-13]BCD66716.1 hypothetical protein NitYY0826_C1663 [Nitratiruptor sp. YY08-26]
MKLLLINKNPVVSRMMLMSVPKAGFEIEECDNVYDLPTGHYEVVVIDDEMYDENFMHDIKQNIQYQKIGLITGTKNAATDEFDFVLHKPFLPTDLMEILREVKASLVPQEEKEEAHEEPFKKFLAAEEEEIEKEFIKEFEPSAPLTTEPIVEIEESKEESPFVKEELDKSGILDEKEIEKVSQLLEDNFIKEGEPSDLVADEIAPLKEESESAHSTIDEIAPLNEEKRELEPSLHSLEDIVPTSSESPESILTSLHEEPQETPDQPFKEEETVSTEQAAVEESTKELQQKSSEIEERASSQPQEQNIQKELTQLGVDKLRELLDGMQIDITIKISFPDKQ